jgi:sodium/potassium-transporting ATPase subunit alpha
MNTANPTPKTKEDNLCVFIKGAPDRIWTRCITILVDGQPMPLTKDVLQELEEANDKFGNKGERVLGFSRLYLDPIVGNNYFNKSKIYDVKEWSKFTTLDEIPANGEFPGYFPMQGLEFVGLCALNDPPRKGVDLSVLKCRAAGIKVIMVTGDQKNTGAAIAAKVNIISDVEREYNFLKRANPDWTEEELMAQSNAIVVHGDELAAVNFKEEGYDDAEIEKGRKVLDWISIKEVVFARTTPSQKLLIVDACQRKGHVVAVTGDGVNDSPAIKKADIGVAMGCGSEVAQNAGDMILLDDDFTSIVNGVEEGRLIFDNLKKSIAYTLSSNIPEISPFLFFIIFQVPLPLSTVLILCIDLGTDMVPAISFAYENPELDIMERYPRNSKRDHLVNSKLISFAYLQIGIVQASAGFFTYFYILNDYGIRPGTTFALALEPGFIPRPQDRYDPYQSNPVPCYALDAATGEYLTDDFGEHIPIEGAMSKYGNCNYDNEAFETVLNWNGNKHNAVDMRLFYTSREPESWSICRWTTGVNGLDFYNQSYVNGTQICYTTEALRFAQAGYLVSIVCVQWSDLMICKTRALSISQQGMVNNNANFALFFETALVAMLCYIPQLGIPLGTRQNCLPSLRRTQLLLLRSYHGLR